MNSMCFPKSFQKQSDVPKQGIVMPWISVRGLPKRCIVRTATSSARVESRPPEIPITALVRMVAKRCFRPVTCSWKMELQKAWRSCFVEGMKGSFCRGYRLPSERRVSVPPKVVSMPPA